MVMEMWVSQPGEDIQVKAQGPSVPWQTEEIEEAARSLLSSSVKRKCHRPPVRMNSGDVECLPRELLR